MSEDVQLTLLHSEFAKPFEPPPLTAPLRFRYTTYMGEAHPAAKKVVVQFCTRDISSLTEPQRIKLIKLAGVRYNPDTDVVKISCEKFEEPAQNKRYLGDLVPRD
jgi:small subunit ribosomal protein S35